MDDGSKLATTDNAPSILTSGDFFAAEDPIALFADWLAAATETEPNDPNAVALATVDPDGMPDVRMVLLKGFDSDGFVFYTNLESRKGEELAATPKAALCFHWKSLRRQVRVRGGVTSVTPDEADAYFASRARTSRLGAWASRQSRPLADRRILEEAVAELDRRYREGDIPRPPHWSGFRIAPEHIEFWKDGAFRLHDRLRFSLARPAVWERARLYP